MEVNKVCRICLKQPETLEPIFGFEFEGVPIVEIIKKVCYDISFIPDASEINFPSNLCSDCVETLCKAFTLNKTCVRSEEELRKLLLLPSFLKVEVFEELNVKIEETEFEDEKSNDDETEDEIKEENHTEESEDTEEDKKRGTRKRRIVVKRHKCPTCLKLFEKPCRLARHLRTHDANKKPFACEEPGCFQRFMKIASLKRHEILHSDVEVKVLKEKHYECIVCSKEFPIQEALASHMRLHKDDNLEFKCNFCDEKFKKLNDLTRHSRKHPGDKSQKSCEVLYACKENTEESEDTEEDEKRKTVKRRTVVKRHKCPTCLKLFDKPSRLVRHAKTHDVNKKPFACEEPGCFQRFITIASLKRHAILHSGVVVKVLEEKHYECVVCSKEFPIQEALASHMRMHKDDNLEFKCNLCDEKFKKLNDLTRHSRKHPENKSHKCLICSKMYSQGSHLIDHLNRHNNVRPHVCHVCNKAFQQSSTLKDHLRTHSLEKPFLCSQCGKSFNNQSNLRQHVKRHLNLKEFACNMCPGKFSCKASLESHVRSHSGLKPHPCSLCSSTFTKGSSLKKHIRTIHEGIKPFACEACSMRFNTSEHLKRHFRTHTGEKPYKCDFEGCDRAYAQTNDLIKHKKVHVGELIYKCTICTDAFRLQSELRDHYKVHYQKDESAEK